MDNKEEKIILTTINAKWIHPSLALRLLKANLGGYEDRAEIIEFALRQPLEEKTAPLIAANPRILGISVSIWNHKPTIELLDALFQEWEKLGREKPIIILGGPETSSLPDDAPLFHYADYAVRGEGERVFRELCAFILGERKGEKRPLAENRENIPSAESVHGKFIQAKSVDLTSIDPGYRLYTDEDLQRKLTYIEASRGCPFGCDFCLSGLDKRVRFFPLSDFLKNMKDLIDRGARSFKFLDRTFNLEEARAQAILEFFLFFMKEEPIQKKKFVHFEMIPSGFPSELRKILARFPPGTLRLEIGIQTFHEKAALLVNRKSDPMKEIENLVFLRRETSAIIHADLIAGLPEEDFSSFADGFDHLWLARPSEIQPGILKILPGTKIAQNAERFGLIFSKEPPYEIIETPSLAKEELDRLKNFARFWELIINRQITPLPETFLSEPIFHRFMRIADKLLERFGRNWGIDKKELILAFLEEAG